MSLKHIYGHDLLLDGGQTFTPAEASAFLAQSMNQATALITWREEQLKKLGARPTQTRDRHGDVTSSSKPGENWDLSAAAIESQFKALSTRLNAPPPVIRTEAPPPVQPAIQLAPPPYYLPQAPQSYVPAVQEPRREAEPTAEIDLTYYGERRSDNYGNLMVYAREMGNSVEDFTQDGAPDSFAHDTDCQCDECIARDQSRRDSGDFWDYPTRGAGDIYRSNLIHVFFADPGHAVHGETNLSRRPFTIKISPQTSAGRAEVTLVHEALHVADRLYKLNLSHDQIHSLAVLLTTEIIPSLRALEALTSHA